MSFKVVYGYTPNTPYEEVSKRLQASLDKFNIPSFSVQLENRNDWIKNCKENAKATRQSLDWTKDDIVYLDADAQVLQYPFLFDHLSCDIAGHIIRYPQKEQFCSGTLFIRNNARSRVILDSWIELNDLNDLWDDDNLYTVIMRDGCVFEELPADYCTIHINRVQSVKNPVIKHWQASRELKDIINHG